MENKTNSTNDKTESWDADLACWRTATSPQCLRVEAGDEVHFFPYGYFQHAKFTRQSGKDVIQIQFQDHIAVVTGKGLDPLCDALQRLAVECIKTCPEKYGTIARNEGVIENIEIKEVG